MDKELGLDEEKVNKHALDFSEDEIQVMLDNLDKYTPEEVAEIDKMVDELATRQHNQAAYDDLIAFVKTCSPIT